MIFYRKLELNIDYNLKPMSKLIKSYNTRCAYLNMLSFLHHHPYFQWLDLEICLRLDLYYINKNISINWPDKYYSSIIITDKFIYAYLIIVLLF